MANAANRLFLLSAALSLALAGCATSSAMRTAQEADQLQEYDRAIAEYSKVLRDEPNNREARRALEVAKLRSSLDHYARGRRHESAGKLEEALVELQIAAELNPGNADIDDRLRTVRTQLRNKVTSRDGKTELETLVERSRELLPSGQELPTDIRMPDSLTFRDASSRDVFLALGKIGSVNVIFDPQFRPQPVSIDLKNSSFQDALQAVSTATRSFYRVTAQRTVTVIPDTTAKRQEYEEEVVRPFFLSNADLKETMDLLRVVIDARRVAPVTATNAIMIKDTPDRVAAAGRIIAAIDKARPEVVIDVELLEVDRTRLKEYGLQVASPGDPPTGINGIVSVNRDGFTLNDLTNLTQSDIFLTNLPNLYYRLLKQDTNTRTLANPQLRTSEGLAGTGAVRRARTGSGHDVRTDRGRRRQSAADYVVQLREHRREHRHHAAHASRRSGVAGAENLGEQHLGNGLRQSAHVRQPRDQHRHPSQGWGDEPSGRLDSRRRTARAAWYPRPQRSAHRREAVCTDAASDTGNGYRDDVDAARHPGARPDRRRPAAFPRR